METIIYRARSVTSLVEREISRLTKEVPDAAVQVVCYQRDKHRSLDQGVAIYGETHIRSLPYPEKLRGVDWNSLTAHHDLPILAFFRDSPELDTVYCIEDDVRYSGNWGALFADLRTSSADLLMTAVQRFEENPEWGWWSTLKGAQPRDRAKGFGPFCRLSRRLLQAVDEAYRAGWDGHFEAVWPSLALARGYCVADLGNGKHYWNTVSDWGLWPGSFIYRPCFKESGNSHFTHSRPLLWHPVKE